jgi:hypothetical protein
LAKDRGRLNAQKEESSLRISLPGSTAWLKRHKVTQLEYSCGKRLGLQTLEQPCHVYVNLQK